MATFEDLAIWRRAKRLTVDIYKLMEACRDYGFRDQIQRAVISISNNIAEGSEYNSDKMMIRYLRIAKGSCGEVKNMFYLCPKLRYCSDEKGKEMIEKCKALTNSIGAFIGYS